jgi:hypothetical protein
MGEMKLEAGNQKKFFDFDRQDARTTKNLKGVCIRLNQLYFQPRIFIFRAKRLGVRCANTALGIALRAKLKAAMTRRTPRRLTPHPIAIS